MGSLVFDVNEFGLGAGAPDEETLATPGKVFMLGVLPFRIDILTEISGVSFAEAWRERIQTPTRLGAVSPRYNPNCQMS